MPRTAGRYGNRAGSAGETAVLAQRRTKFRLARAAFTVLGLRLAGRNRRPAPSAKTGGSAELDASVVRLAERAQMLGFLRESLYRTCERAAAGQITKEEATAAYDKVMNSVHAIIETDRDLAKESAAKALKSLSPEQIKALK
jgi:hypothetical protein